MKNPFNYNYVYRNWKFWLNYNCVYKITYYNSSLSFITPIFNKLFHLKIKIFSVISIYHN